MAWSTLPQGTLWQSSNDPLAGALNPIPSTFLTGDGHRRPMFNWVTRNRTLKEHLLTRLAENKLCLHVELQQEEVNHSAINPSLHAALDQGKVFGWELPIYKELKPLMELYSNPPRGAEAVAAADSMLRVDGLLSQFGDAGGLQFMRPRIEDFRKRHSPPQSGFSSLLSAFGKPEASTLNPAETENEDLQFLIAYYNAGWQMRTSVNPEIAANIQSNISQHPDHTHLITCGHTHLSENPLHHYLHPAGGTSGVVDQDPGEDLTD